MTIAELENRVHELESRLADLEQQMEREVVRASLRRAREQVDRGEVVPAREHIAALRAKHGLNSL